MPVFSRLLSYLRPLLTGPARWLSTAGNWLGLSLPARVMAVLFVFLILCVVGFYTFRYFYTDAATFATLFEARFVIPLLVCVIALPITAYYATRFWLETPPSEFPDIDGAWRAGVATLARAGVDIHQLPLYLVLGVTNPKTADHMMQAAGWELLVDGAPDGAQPLRWYASKRAIMLFVLDAGSISKLHTAPIERQPEASAVLRGTLVGSAAALTPQAAHRGIRGTILASEVDAAPQTLTETAVATSPVSIKGTMLVSHGEAVDVATGSAARTVPSAGLDRQERELQSQRMKRVCELAATARLPFCPLNGVLAIVDWNVLLNSREGQLAAAARADYSAIVESARLYAPLIVLVNGLDVDPGFVELVRRVGEERAENNRFGHGFSHLISPTHDQMVALAAHASGAFEDWIYDLFKHPDCLERSNNEKLFSLLVKTRNELRPRLAEMLTGLATDGRPGRGAMLGGCYFGAAGKNNMRQAFMRSVVEKLVELEDDIEWTEEAIASERRLQGLIRFVIFLNAMLIVFIVWVVVYVFVSQ